MNGRLPTCASCLRASIAVRAFLLVGIVLGAHSARTQEVTDDGRIGVIFAHPIAGELSGAPYVWFDDQTDGVKTYRVSIPDVDYRARSWLHGVGGFLVNWTDGQGNTREIRPYVGVKIFMPNSAHLHLYDLTRFEWRRITNTASDTITREVRFRTRPGVEFPLSARAWEPATFYGLANGEIFVEHSFVDALRFMSGAGYIKSDRVRIEFQYVLELSRKASTDPLAYKGNSFRLDFKFSFKHGLLQRQEGE
jgi:hypothetical protein